MTVSAISQLLLPTLMSGVVNEGVYEKDFTVIWAIAVKCWRWPWWGPLQ